ncbi:MAG: succinate dehydrogenase, hydrophobic membrane anchor protein [Moraxellaceae bacterium]|nr:succinate dehydrogenase, hydrophobic membrane anchor protein [Moraxellaceae bacterium]MDZ4385754.1 succinate dehydrogenase, hydrophobic membrane anchor protein [Moraxellaceae bacterium]
MKSATSFSRSGLSDWLIQRVSAIILAAYTVWLFGFFIINSNVDYATWHAFMSGTCMRIFTLMALLSFVAHAWIGMWTVFTDYLTTSQMGQSANVVRLVAQIVMAIALFVVIVWGIQIIWGN